VEDNVETVDEEETATNEIEDFSDVLNSTAIEEINEETLEETVAKKSKKEDVEELQQATKPENSRSILPLRIDLIPVKPAAAHTQSIQPDRTQTAAAKPEVEFVEARQVECPDCDKVFTARAKLLGHLVTHHYSAKILALHPLRRGPCTLCTAAGRGRVFEIKDRSNHLRHVGQSHEAVLEVARDEVRDIVSLFSRATRRRVGAAGPGDTSREALLNDSREIGVQIKAEPAEPEKEEPMPAFNVFQELEDMAESGSPQESLAEESNKEGTETTRDETEEPEEFNCTNCEMRFDSSDAQAVHMVQYAKVHAKVYSCRYCKVTSVGTRSFKDHLVSHRNQKQKKTGTN
jgi:hypothetical protein